MLAMNAKRDSLVPMIYACMYFILVLNQIGLNFMIETINKGVHI